MSQRNPHATPQPPSYRAALVAGASGLVGSEILRGLLADAQGPAVHSVGRRRVDVHNSRLTQHLVDFIALPPLPPLTEAYIALGTTIQQAGSKAAFQAVDLDAVLAVASAAFDAGATKLGVISAMGADPASAIFYNRVKGEMEQALQALGFEVLVIARPALLAGNRAKLQQPPRTVESMGLRAMRWIAPVVPKNYQPVTAANVATALCSFVQTSPPGVHVVLSGNLHAT
jgi:uncharacterized protein YbjT (DUF2867 family)